MTLETLTGAQQRLTAAGFTEHLVVDDGRLRSTSTGDLHDPEALRVAEIVRFEGESDPDDEAILLAIAGRDNAPIGTMVTAYGPNASDEEAEMLRHLHRVLVSPEERAAHDEHDHIGAVFADRTSAEAAIDDLREIGLGSDHLGTAIADRDRIVFEHDESEDFLHDVEAGVATGAVMGLVGGMLIFGLALPGVGTLGVGGILAVGAATGLGGALFGGFAGVGAASRDLAEHERLRHTPLGDGEVLVVACSHDHATLVERALQRHGGRLLPPGAVADG
ncbi:MAG: hypothetical protein OEV40_05820 [Acidimicrobiia bacterium]|nr:hypothetical protein [Acidimicrobiia bacterium]